MRFNSFHLKLVHKHEARKQPLFRPIECISLNYNITRFIGRVPAHEIEQVVLAELRDRFPDQPTRAEDQSDDNITILIERIERIDVLQDVLSVILKSNPVETDADEIESTTANKISIPWTKPSMFRKTQTLGQPEKAVGNRPMRSETRFKLLKGIAQGRIWLDWLVNTRAESFTTIANKHGLSEKTVRSTITLALLAPDIVDAAIGGRLPRGLTTTQMLDLPADWQEQRKMLLLA